MGNANPIELEVVILSSDSELVKILTGTLHRSDIEATIFTDSSAAADYISNRKVDAVIVDSEVTGAIALLETVRETASNARVPTFVIIHKEELYRDLAAAAHFIIKKPVSQESFERALRAAHNVMLRERRRYYRLPVRLPVVLVRARGQMLVNGTSLNISENGMALRSELPLNQRELVDLRFGLPGVPTHLGCSAQVVWADSQGLGGVHFVSLDKEAQRILTIWIQKQFEGEASASPSRHQ
jgi:DNA-binding response OmpR family regulator